MKLDSLRTKVLTPSRFIIYSLLLLEISAQSTNLTAPSVKGLARCLPLVPGTQLGLIQDCAGAILRLPQGAQITTFSNVRGDVGYLPQIKSYGDCTVTVYLTAGRDESSWTAVGLAASLLMNACVDFTRNFRYTGGSVVTGNTGAIGITLERSNRAISGKVNTSGSLLEE